LFTKIKKSLVFQNHFLFIISIIFIGILWFIFYIEQKHQLQEHNLARYFNIATILNPYIIENKTITNDMLSPLEIEKFTGEIPKKHTIELTKGTKKKGFQLIVFKGHSVLYIYNPFGEIYLNDVHVEHNMLLVHSIFILLISAQILLYLKLNSSLYPLSFLSNKLKSLKQGDRTPLEIDSKYDEIEQIVNSYNDSIGKIDYMLETREMFNKIFMHEMKMPLAKGMFYLKLEPSEHSHEKLQNILNNINQELEEFSQIEALITYQNDISKNEHNFIEILEISKNRVDGSESNIETINLENFTLKGDREFWILCVKNLIDNALKYASDGRLIIENKDNQLIFKNKGEPLPVDISKDIKKWKIDKNIRHKSSTGYGFGLFIIKNIVTLHGYNLEYRYNETKKEVFLKII